MAEYKEVLEVAGRKVAISNPRKVLFPKPGYTKLDLARYYLALADGALRGAGGRPNMLVRYPNGVEGEFFFQKRAPQARPDWLEVVELKFPSGRSADEVVPETRDQSQDHRQHHLANQRPAALHRQLSADQAAHELSRRHGQRRA